MYSKGATNNKLSIRDPLGDSQHLLTHIFLVNFCSKYKLYRSMKCFHLVYFTNLQLLDQFHIARVCADSSELRKKSFKPQSFFLFDKAKFTCNIINEC